MSHGHLKFLNHGENLGASATSLGGINVPVLQGGAEVKEHDTNRSQHQKHVEVVDYLKDSFYDTKVKSINCALVLVLTLFVLLCSQALKISMMP